jgi:mono/diheme cytochrome c family protein
MAISRTQLFLTCSVWASFALESGLGLGRIGAYRPTTEAAWKTASAPNTVSDAHYWLSAITIVLAVLNVFWLLWSGKISRDNRWLWWGGIGALGVALAFQMTGNLLPFSDHDARTAFAEASIASGVPGLGEQLRTLTLAGSEVGAATLDRWYLAHRIVLPIALLLLAVPVLRSLRGAATIRTWLAALIPGLLAFALAAGLEAPHGVPAGADDFAAGGARPMWYVLPLHAALLQFESWSPTLGWVGAVLAPLVLGVALASLPLMIKGERPASTVGKLLAILGVVCLGLAVASAGSRVQMPHVAEPAFSDVTKPPAADTPIDPVLQAIGEKLFETAKCITCHRLGKRGDATIGPVLDGIGTRRPDPDFYLLLFRDPEAAGAPRMPKMSDLSQEQMRALAEYLRSQK